MKSVRVFVKEPGKAPVEKVIPNTLEAFQSAVGGYIETLTVEDDLLVICNEEGRLLKLPRNCDVCGISFVGTIVLVGTDGEDFTDVPISITEFEEMIEE